jgi:hypothetical protein
MCSGAGDTTQLVPGYPIRTPWDHSSVDSSPRPIAASHVLHRLLVPRHPPFALDNLTTKMLASTMQFTTNNQPTTPQRHPPPATTPTRMRHQRQFAARPRLDRKPNPTHPRARVVPSGPNRVPNTGHQPHQPPPPHPSRPGKTRNRQGSTRTTGHNRPPTHQRLHPRAPPPHHNR